MNEHHGTDASSFLTIVNGLLAQRPQSLHKDAGQTESDSDSSASDSSLSEVSADGTNSAGLASTSLQNSSTASQALSSGQSATAGSSASASQIADALIRAMLGQRLSNPPAQASDTALQNSTNQTAILTGNTNQALANTQDAATADTDEAADTPPPLPSASGFDSESALVSANGTLLPRKTRLNKIGSDTTSAGNIVPVALPNQATTDPATGNLPNTLNENEYAPTLQSNAPANDSFRASQTASARDTNMSAASANNLAFTAILTAQQNSADANTTSSAEAHIGTAQNTFQIPAQADLSASAHGKDLSGDGSGSNRDPQNSGEPSAQKPSDVPGSSTVLGTGALSAATPHFAPTGQPAEHIPSVSQTSNASDSVLAQTSGVSQQAPAQVLTPRIHEMVVRVNQPDAPSVDLQISQRQGEVRVAVRTPDSSLETSLRQNLPDLVNSLDRAGFHTETFLPRSPAAGSEIGSIGETQPGNLSQENDSSHARGGSSGQDGSPQSQARQEFQQNAGQHFQQSTRDRLAQSWLNQMEA